MSKNGIVVQGAPGTGKSCLVWSWICHVSQKQNKKVLWIHVDPKLLPQCVELSLNSMRTFSDDMSTVLKVMKSTDADIVVFDGYRASEPTHDFYVNYLFPRRCKRSTNVLVSSMAGLSGSCIGVFLSNGVSFYAGNNWAIEEYKQACTEPEFLRSILPNLACDEESQKVVDSILHSRPEINLDLCAVNQLIDKKFYYVGGCARWMFAFPHQKVLFVIKVCVESVNDYKALIERSRGIRNDCQCNQLLVAHDNSNIAPSGDLVFVSHYVARTVLRMCELSVIKSAYDLGDVHKNPAFLGWVVEFDFAAQLKLAAQAQAPRDRYMQVYSHNGTMEKWRVPAVCEFDKNFLPAVQRELMDGYWLRPKDWNEAGFDMVCLIREDEVDGIRILRFVQITRGKSHMLNLTYFDSLATKVHALTGIEICVDIVVMSLDCMLPPKITVVGSGPATGLSKWRVLSGEFRWPAGQEALHIRYLCFHPCNSVAVQSKMQTMDRGWGRGRGRGTGRGRGRRAKQLAAHN